MKTRALYSLIMAVVLGFSTGAWAEEAVTPLASWRSLTGIWEITLTSLTDSGQPVTPSKPTVFQMPWTDTGAFVLGSIETDRWVGRRDGDRLSITVLSQGNSDRDAKQSGLEVTGNIELQKLWTRSPSWQGDGFGLEPAEGIKAFETFNISARRVSTETGATVQGTNWCEEIDLNKIVQACFTDIPFIRPMDVCTVQKNGAGFYLFGSVAPGSGGHPYGAATVYFPWQSTGLCTSREYGFTLQSGGNISTIQELITALQAATALLNYLHIDASTIENELLSWYNQYGAFAISIGYSMNTHYTTMYINTGSGANPAICNAIENSSIGQAIRAVFNRAGFGVMCGNSISDNYNLRRSIIPDLTFQCSTPVSFLYLFGMINVTYD